MAKKCIFYAFFYRKTCIIEIKAVPLHAKSRASDKKQTGKTKKIILSGYFSEGNRHDK